MITWVYYTRRGGLLHDIERAPGAHRAPFPQTCLPERTSTMSHLLDRLNFLQSKELEQFSDG